MASRTHAVSLEVKTAGRGTVDITSEVQAIVQRSGVERGLCNIFIHHTSASLIVCENADPSVRSDLERFMARLVPDGDAIFEHTDEGPDDEGEPSDEDWTTPLPAPETKDEAARMLYDLALTFQERSQHSEARLIEQFEVAAVDLAPFLGDMMVLDDADERLWFRSNGTFEAEVVPQSDEEGTPPDEWRRLSSPDELVEFYDPTDVFGDFAEALAETYPGIASDADTDEDADEL